MREHTYVKLNIAHDFLANVKVECEKKPVNRTLLFYKHQYHIRLQKKRK